MVESRGRPSDLSLESVDGTASHPSVVPRWQRSLLPGALLAETRADFASMPPGAPRRSLLDWVVDVAGFALAVAVGALILISTWSRHADAIAGLDAVCGSLACLALWVRRSHPLAVGLFAIAVSAFSAMAAGAALIAAYNVAVHGSLRATAWIAALSLLASAIFAGLYVQGGGSYDFGSLGIGVLFIGVAIGWGLFARARRELVLSLNDRARRVEAEQRDRVRQARSAERTLIAREMHDVLAHRLSLLSVHAGALEFRPDAPPEEIERAAGVIRDSAHAALQELRQVIGLLREPDASADGEATEPPQPTLADVPALVEESRDAGMKVRLKLELEEADAVPTAVGRTVYRIVQEGLTNARKHAAASVVDVEIAGDPAGPVTAAVVSRPLVGTAAPPSDAWVPGTATGLIGLAERVSIAGGRLTHGPTTGGGYALRATLPRSP
jgi:signal transduction histidine kinase